MDRFEAYLWGAYLEGRSGGPCRDPANPLYRDSYEQGARDAGWRTAHLRDIVTWTGDHLRPTNDDDDDWLKRLR